MQLWDSRHCVFIFIFFKSWTDPVICAHSADMTGLIAPLLLINVPMNHCTLSPRTDYCNYVHYFSTLFFFILHSAQKAKKKRPFFFKSAGLSFQIAVKAWKVLEQLIPTGGTVGKLEFQLLYIFSSWWSDPSLHHD